LHVWSSSPTRRRVINLEMSDRFKFALGLRGLATAAKLSYHDRGKDSPGGLHVLCTHVFDVNIAIFFCFEASFVLLCVIVT